MRLPDSNVPRDTTPVAQSRSQAFDTGQIVNGIVSGVIVLAIFALLFSLAYLAHQCMGRRSGQQEHDHEDDTELSAAQSTSSSGHGGHSQSPHHDQHANASQRSRGAATTSGRNNRRRGSSVHYRPPTPGPGILHVPYPTMEGFASPRATSPEFDVDGPHQSVLPNGVSRNSRAMDDHYRVTGDPKGRRSSSQH
ncbi:unnamed protein product [Parascedosporium putredinis]|uniref:Uncharacterized protein n=1 Tax=Parascedosporium putredinis TaxID=1442378 RepID=A0A9P1MES4_9PEZI|nr:unnamed protein product [Parascedosporium putredinis]CAI8003384.1 unnamed protein product [Parascedosporium putredinis]